MNKIDSRTGIYIALGVAILLVFAYFLFGKNPSPVYSWVETYRADDRQPFGTYILFELLSDHNRKALTEMDLPLDSLPALTGKKKLNYVFVGEDYYYYRSGMDSLLSFVHEGNSAFIACKNFPYDLLGNIEGASCLYHDVQWQKKGLLSLNYANDTLHYPFEATWDTTGYDWGYLNRDNCEKEGGDVLGMWENDINYLKLAHGEGFFLLHTNPIVFTNYFMVDSMGFAHAEGVFSYLGEGDILWDKLSKLPYTNEKTNKTEGPLKYILSVPSLRWAWYLFLISILVYFIFYAKRKQRAIPILPSKINSTIEFTETMGRLYFSQKDNDKIVAHKTKLFLSYLRSRYQLTTNELDDELALRTCLKSGIERSKIDAIFKANKLLSFKNDTTDEQLIAYHQQLEFFYKNCK